MKIHLSPYFNRLPGRVSFATIAATLLLSGCAYFNTFYNAKKYYELGVVGAGDVGRLAADKELPVNVQDDFSKAIKKSLTVIEEFPDSRYVHQALFIIGRSHFYRQEYGLAERYLTQVLTEYPWLGHLSEIRVWLAKTHVEMGAQDALADDLASLAADKNASRNLMAEVHSLRGDIALRRGNLGDAVTAYEQAVKMTNQDAHRATLYLQLFTLMEKNLRYEEALGYLNQYRRYAANKKDRQDAVLTRVRLLQQMGRLDESYKEIRSMLGLSEFVEVVPGLQVELAKIELNSKDTDQAVGRFKGVIEEFGTLPEAGEAAFRLGEFYQIREHNADLAWKYYQKVKQNSPYYTLAKARMGQLKSLGELQDNLQILEKSIGATRTTLTKVVNRFSEFEGIDVQHTLDGELARRRNPRKKGTAGSDIQDDDFRPESRQAANIPTPRGEATPQPELEESQNRPEIDTSKVRQNIADNLFRLGENYLIDMLDTAKTLEMLTKIVADYPETNVTPKSIFVLLHILPDSSDQHEFWKAVLLEKYGHTEFAALYQNGNAPGAQTLLDSLSQLADEAVLHDPGEALRIFERIRDKYGTEHSTFAIAYLYDSYLGDLENAILAYEEHLRKHPSGAFSEPARERLSSLQHLKAAIADETAEPPNSP